MNNTEQLVQIKTNKRLKNSEIAILTSSSPNSVAQWLSGKSRVISSYRLQMLKDKTQGMIDVIINE